MYTVHLRWCSIAGKFASELSFVYLFQEELNMVKKFMCVKHAEDCYALQEAVRFVAFFQ